MEIYELKESSILKAHLFWNRYPEWMPNLPWDHGKDSNPYVCEFQSSEHLIPHLLLIDLPRLGNPCKTS